MGRGARRSLVPRLRLEEVTHLVVVEQAELLDLLVGLGVGFGGDLEDGARHAQVQVHRLAPRDRVRVHERVHDARV